MPSLRSPLLIVSYVDETLAELTAILAGSGVGAAPCATFCEAEHLALHGLYSGLLVDLSSIIKAKGEEKIVAYTLANFFPTLRMRSPGSLLVPGNAEQESNLDDFLSTACAAFAPRKLREFRRHKVCTPTLINYRNKEYRGFTLDVSWSGAFLVDVFPERFDEGTGLMLTFVESGLTLDASVSQIKAWGHGFAPGIGVHFNDLDESAQSVFAEILQSVKEFDRDRLTL